METPRVLLVKGSAGLGNRILSLLSGLLFARLTGRTLAVDWSDPLYARNGENSFPLLFSKPLSAVIDPQTASVAPSFWEHRLDTDVDYWLASLERRRDWSSMSADLARLDCREEVLVFWAREERIRQQRRHFRGEHQPLARRTDDAILRDLIRSDLAPHPEIAQQVRDFQQCFWSEEVIGVHLRYSDRRFRVHAIFRHLDRMAASRPQARVFVAADNKDLLRYARDRYGADRVIATAKWFSTPGEPLHLSAGGPDGLRKAQDAIVEMYLLGSCGWLVGDQRSSFAYIAALLFDSRPERIINVDPAAFLPRWVCQFYGFQRNLLMDDLRYLRRHLSLGN